MLAIPVFRSRVAPVLDWCSMLVVFPRGSPSAAAGREISVMRENLFSVVRTLQEQGIQTLICGALSPEMLIYCEGIGLRIIHGVAGEIEEVLRAYREEKLDQPQFRLPGCSGQGRYRAGARRADEATETEKVNKSKPVPCKRFSGSLGGNRAGGRGGFCICPQCGSRQQHERGIPCSQLRCPACQGAMTRE